MWTIAFNRTHLDNRNKLQVIEKLRKNTVILKAEEVNCVAVVDRTDYYESLNKLFSDAEKSKTLDADPTNSSFTTL